MIRIDREMIIEDIMAIRALVPVENDEARERIDKLINLLSTLPNDEKQAQFPKPSMRRL
jgi:predicted translin family RNA/ssDNA-binding protein